MEKCKIWTLQGKFYMDISDIIDELHNIPLKKLRINDQKCELLMIINKLKFIRQICLKVSKFKWQKYLLFYDEYVMVIYHIDSMLWMQLG